jgi:hypothetical protein
MQNLVFNYLCITIWKRLAPGMPGRSYQTKPGLPSGFHVNIKCFYAKSTCLIGSNYRNISSLTLVQKDIPGYLQRTVDNYSWAYLWLISHDLSHGVPLMWHSERPAHSRGYSKGRVHQTENWSGSTKLPIIPAFCQIPASPSKHESA